MADLHLSDVAKHFGSTRAVDGVSLTLTQGEFLALLGPSGCGKTTILRMIAGFETVTAGTIRHGDTVWADGEAGRHVPAEKRRVGVVFQSYALWPHLSVADNIGYPLRVQKQSRRERSTAVDAALETVGLSGLGERRPADLSGGQRQRVALARCLVMRPEVVVLDEPLANLDVHLRETMMEAFMAFHRETGATMLYITHDQAEAMAMADRVAVMFDGRIEQIDAPNALYDRPATEAVARFIGEGTVLTLPISQRNGDAVIVDLFGHPVPVPVDGHDLNGADHLPVCIRPHRCRIDPSSGMPAAVRGATYRGGHWFVDVAPDAHPDVRLQLQTSTKPPVAGSSVTVAVDAVTPIGPPIGA